jgi:glycosyltransferase involved in cell wall biosynthesis
VEPCRLADLPPPPPGNTGWPWTVESSRLPKCLPNGDLWPSISIVTPSYNQGKYLEETIRSILLQGYPNLEYMIFDGESTDDSVDIIRKYAPWLSYWTSERDRGQANAINKALSRSSGHVFHWINSDDVLAPGALHVVGSEIKQFDAVAGGITVFGDGRSKQYKKNSSLTPVQIITPREDSFCQPALWLLRKRILEHSGFNEKYQCVFDWELVIRYLSTHENINYVDFNFVDFRLHENSKTMAKAKEFDLEIRTVLQDISHSSTNRRQRAAGRRLIKQLEWQEFLSSLRADTRQSRWFRTARIIIGMVGNPGSRVNRFSIGAILRILGPNVKNLQL